MSNFLLKLVFHIDEHWICASMIRFPSDSDNNGSAGKESVCNAGDAGNEGWIPGWRRSLGVEKPHRQRSLVGYIQSMGS